MEKMYSFRISSTPFLTNKAKWKQFPLIKEKQLWGGGRRWGRSKIRRGDSSYRQEDWCKMWKLNSSAEIHENSFPTLAVVFLFSFLVSIWRISWPIAAIMLSTGCNILLSPFCNTYFVQLLSWCYFNFNHIFAFDFVIIKSWYPLSIYTFASLNEINLRYYTKI